MNPCTFNQVRPFIKETIKTYLDKIKENDAANPGKHDELGRLTVLYEYLKQWLSILDSIVLQRPIPFDMRQSVDMNLPLTASLANGKERLMVSPGGKRGEFATVDFLSIIYLAFLSE